MNTEIFTPKFIKEQKRIMRKLEEALCNHSIPDKNIKYQYWEDFRAGQSAATEHYYEALCEIERLQIRCDKRGETLEFLANKIARLEERNDMFVKVLNDLKSKISSSGDYSIHRDDDSYMTMSEILHFQMIFDAIDTLLGGE